MRDFTFEGGRLDKACSSGYDGQSSYGKRGVV